jgi:hypothetical protein
MEQKKRIPIKAQITYEVKEYNDAGSDELSYYDYDDMYTNKSSIENDTFDVEFDLPDSKEDFIEALERWNDYIPDEAMKNDFEEGFGMMQYDEEYYEEEEDMAEFAHTKDDNDSKMHTSIPQKIMLFFDDNSEEEVEITNQDDTLRRVMNILEYT